MTDQFTAKAKFFLPDPHTQAVMSSICYAQTVYQAKHPNLAGNGRLCILGFGECPDLDLKQLLRTFSQVHLIDRESALMEQVIAAHHLTGDERLIAFENFDFTGIQFELDRLAANSKPKSDLTAVIQRASQFCWESLPQEFEVVVSTCLLSQLIGGIVEAITDNHDQFVPLIQAVRRRHLELMINQLTPGGIGLLVFDFVSSDTLPALTELEDEPLQRTLSAAIDHNNFFHGLNPQVLLHLFEKELADRIEHHQFSKPWVWKTSERTYAVAGIMFQKK